MAILGEIGHFGVFMDNFISYEDEEHLPRRKKEQMLNGVDSSNLLTAVVAAAYIFNFVFSLKQNSCSNNFAVHWLFV